MKKRIIKTGKYLKIGSLRLKVVKVDSRRDLIVLWDDVESDYRVLSYRAVSKW